MQQLQPKSKPAARQAKAPQYQAKKVSRRYATLNSGRGQYAETNSARMALMHSKYLNSVLDPFNEPGAKVPDEITAPSFTAQTIQKLIANAAPGTGAGATTIGVGFSTIVGATGNNNSSNSYIAFPTSTAGLYTYASASGPWPGGASLLATASMVRPVSAAICVQILGSLNNNQGRILIGYLPPGDANSGVVTANATMAGLSAATYVADVPASKVAARAIWLPLDDIARSYTTIGSPTLGNQRGGNAYQFGQLFVLCDGLVAGVEVECQIVINWEVIPLSNQLNITAPNASQSDPIEMAVASNFIAGNPLIAVHQPETLQVTGTPLSGGIAMNKGSHPSFLDKVLSGLSGGLKVAKRIAPVAAEILAML
jgi:hypothetical protein